MIDLQRGILLDTIRATSGNDWKVLVVDEKSRRLIDGIAKEDDILNCNIINVEQIEQRRQAQPDTDAIYLLYPLPHIVETLKADLARKRYRRSFLIWISPLPRHLADELFRSESRQRQIANSRSLNIDYYPRESHVITFREPSSFHALFHPNCDSLVKAHLDTLTQKIVSICVSLQEYPLVKYYRPRNPRHEASVLCSHLASFVQDALDNHARDPRNNFPPQSQSARPRAILFITDRTMDLMSPLVHELTYQAMAMDLLPLRDDNEKIIYRNVIRRGQPDQEEKEVEINDNDRIWVNMRHMHMKDLLVRLSADFNKFQELNKHFAETGEQASLNTIKDMLAGLPEFQEGKEAFSLHIDMAEKCAKMFAEHKLLDLTSVEQSLATGMDEDNKRPKNLADQLVRLLDDESIIHEDRVRLLIMYVLYRNGILGGDIEKLRNHGQLSPVDGEIIYNLDMLGVRVRKPLKDTAPAPPPLFAPRITNIAPGEEVSLSRFEPNLRYMLEEQCQGTLDPVVFPAVKPHLDNTGGQSIASETSLRSASKPTWASQRSQSQKPRQRLIVFMAGGATYAESRTCYEVSQALGKEVFLATSHMLTPKVFLRQVSMLSAGRKQLGLPADQPPPQLPAWMSEPPPQALQPVQSQQSRPQQQPSGRPPDQPKPPTDGFSNLHLDQQQNGTRPNIGSVAHSSAAPPSSTAVPQSDPGKLKKEKKEKKHLGLFKKHH